jgi:hypothetical protein
MAAPIATAPMKARVQRSYLIAIRCQFPGPAEHALDAIALFVSLLVLFDRFVSAEPNAASVPRLATASRNQSLPQPFHDEQRGAAPACARMESSKR